MISISHIDNTEVSQKHNLAIPVCKFNKNTKISDKSNKLSILPFFEYTVR